MSLRHLPVLAIDPSTNTGYALWDPESKRVHYGSWYLGAGKPHGEYFSEFLGRIEALIEERGFSKDLRLRLVIEAPTPNAQRSAKSLRLSEGWGAVLSLWCFQKRLVPPEFVVVNQWRSPFLKHAKKPSALKGTESTRWYKEQTRLACNSFGLTPKDFDSADAIGILRWMLDGGYELAKREREQRRREQDNARAQHSLVLTLRA